MNSDSNTAAKKREFIQASGFTIYDIIDVGDVQYWYTSEELTEILNAELIGTSFNGLKIRTRSKEAKSLVCKALGYPIPISFKKSKPRFLGQKFDTYVQKANNLQVWNEELDPIRRYVLIRVDASDIVIRVRVISGVELAKLDTTGTLTQKYQARLVPADFSIELITESDTDNLESLIDSEEAVNLGEVSPVEHPSSEKLMSISYIFSQLKKLVGCTFKDSGSDQERNRGAELHKIVCKCLGYSSYKDNGQFPDVKHQLLEVKLQTSPTIDLGLVCPDSLEFLDMEKIDGVNIRHCDIRYAIFYGETDGMNVRITNFYLTTGEGFFSRFPKFGGKVLNKKLQIPLPRNFFADV
jgi:hypothetical protein